MDRDFRIEIGQGLESVDAASWDALAAATPGSTMFQRHAWLAALERSACAVPRTGWQALVPCLYDDAGALAAACVVYAKGHSMGEYVFDWSWADAHERCGLPYYPKLLLATPFTPVRGPRLLGRDPGARAALLGALLDLARKAQVSSLHLLFLTDEEQAWCEAAGLMSRSTVQYHWRQAVPPWPDFEAFIGALNHDKRKKLRQERRKVRESGVEIRRLRGREIDAPAWELFVRCYEQTYAEHGSMPYLNLDFFRRLGEAMPEHLLLIVASLQGEDVACSLILLDPALRRAYGRYWGALRHVPLLHFELCYYEPLQFCLEQGFEVFEGGAQGSHKMARGLLPVECRSAHWVAEPRLRAAIAAHLDREGEMMGEQLEELRRHLPLRRESAPQAPGQARREEIM
ncbi:GNAT family N-acetyltransferase [Thiomonas sp. FB-6]|uniref:GNAT family N-acetyltransferase n=1 Tax=Thiomonas sp. FB-6 TaxID=1158291 RepID=UPI00037B3520|nr:GNAT family N-acetyltransferase [Thiomonas sp. FB-6]